MFAVFNCLQDELPGDTLPADHFDDNVDFRIINDRVRIAGHGAVRQPQPPVSFGIDIGHPFQIENLPALGENPGHTGANRAAAE